MLEDTYVQFAAKAMALEPFALVFAMILCGAGALLLNQVVNSPLLKMASLPGLMIGAITGNHDLRLSGLSISPDPQIGSIVAASAGMIVVLVLFTIVAHAAGTLEPKTRRAGRQTGRG